jgi:hypothetical protein
MKFSNFYPINQMLWLGICHSQKRLARYRKKLSHLILVKMHSIESAKERIRELLEGKDAFMSLSRLSRESSGERKMKLYRNNGRCRSWQTALLGSLGVWRALVSYLTISLINQSKFYSFGITPKGPGSIVRSR